MKYKYSTGSLRKYFILQILKYEVLFPRRYASQVSHLYFAANQSLRQSL